VDAEGKPAVAVVIKNAVAVFDDVKTDDWFFEYVFKVKDAGLMQGVSETSFDPYGNLTRGMLVTMLYRLDGTPEITENSPFADVDEDSYYKNAVAWAYKNGIVMGIGDTAFAPDEFVTREQFATVMFRYAQYKGTAPVGAWAIRLQYADIASISDYAVEAVMFCTKDKIMTGRPDNLFSPSEFASRAEAAAIICRFNER
jgi:hypothetical protein